jgi:Tfp pilus assembly protein PilV
MKFATPNHSREGFTLAEVMAALLFLAIVIPTAIEAMHVASLAGEVGARKGAAARIADRVLSESLVTTNWSGTQSGTATEGGLDFRWTLTSQGWPQDAALQVVSARVKFSAQDKEYEVELDTLATQTGVTNLNVTR